MIEYNLLIVICDTQRAHIYKNTGSSNTPHLNFVTGFEQKNPPSHEHGSDKPGTIFASKLGQRSHVTSEDFHMAEQKLFARTVINSITTLKKDNPSSKIAWIAPPKMLSYLREFMPPELKASSIAQLTKDLTKHPTLKITDILNNLINN